jgi:hypothetical protein
MVRDTTEGGIDDPLETVLYAGNDNDDANAVIRPGDDHVFGPEELQFLQSSNNDATRYNVQSRVEKLAPFNFASDPSLNSRGEEIRKKFTTVSHDRRTFSLPLGAVNSGGTMVSERPWEFNLDPTQGSANRKFPPQFGTIARYAATDPFRPAVRWLLEVQQNTTSDKQYQHKLDVTRLLYIEQRPGGQQSRLAYRELTDHPTDPGAAAIATTTTYPPTTPAQQEYWARRDRQQQARDIYVLLYLLGGPYDHTGDTGHSSAVGNNGAIGDNSGRNVYSDQQLEQMARFAVNLVDAQDRDNVMTRFEYDTNLNNGWNLDDNPYSSTGDTDRAEVWGVERQEFAFSEALAFRAVGSTTPRTYTSWTDSNERHWACVELRNLAPYAIDFQNEEWQLVLRQHEPDESGYTAAVERQVTFKTAAGIVGQGGFFTVYSTDRSEAPAGGFTHSAFAVDATGGGAPSSPTDWIVPSIDVTSLVNPDNKYLDLVADAATSKFEIRDGTGSTALSNPGDFLTNGAPDNFVLDPMLPVRFILRRRAHPTRAIPTTAAAENDNPWVEVDRINTPSMSPSRQVDFSMAMTATEIADELDNLQSIERPEPLDQANATPHASASPVSNTFRIRATGSPNAENSNVDTVTYLTNRYWQQHFDRPLQSLAELFFIPLVGPPPFETTPAAPPRTDGLTLYMASMFQPPTTQHSQAVVVAPNYITTTPAQPTPFWNYAKSAAGMFIVPDSPTLGTAGTRDANDNRWHRFLEFVEIGTKMNRARLGTNNNTPENQTGDTAEFLIHRTPGKINFNTLRYPEVQAALIDDETVASLDLYGNDQLGGPPVNPQDVATSANRPRLVNLTDGTTRDWFLELQQSRDGADPFWTTAGTYNLPGMPGSRPFRSLSYLSRAGGTGGAPSIADTVLRETPADAGVAVGTSRRRLFEVGTAAEHQGSGAAQLDPVLRQRIFSKLMGNSTTRSNAYVVFISVKLFRAVVDDVGAVRVGGPVDITPATTALPEYRGFFVVDRSRLEKGRDLTSFVTYRKILDEP